MDYKCPYSKERRIELFTEIHRKWGKPLTVRQFYYELLQNYGLCSPEWLAWVNGLDEKNRGKKMKLRSKDVSTWLTKFRREGVIPWEWVVDEERHLEKSLTFKNLAERLGTIQYYYARDLLQSQPKHIEVWCEKILAIDDICAKYQVGLMRGGGFQSATNIKDTAKRLSRIGKPAVILYLGDFDPSGLDVDRSIGDELRKLAYRVTIKRILLTEEDIEELPSIPAPEDDPRIKKYSEKYGYEAWELQAMSPGEIFERLEESIISELDMNLFEEEKAKYEDEIEQLEESDIVLVPKKDHE